MELKDRLDWRERPGRFVVYLIVFGLIMWLIGYGSATLIGKAYGAEAAGPASAAAPPTECTWNTCPVKRTNRRTARKFRNDKISKASGFRSSKLFKQPKKSRRILVRRIDHVQDVAAAKVANKMGVTPKEEQCDRCEAWAYYKRMQKRANCIGRGEYATHQGTCINPYHNTRPLTRREVQAGGTAIFCAGSLVFGVAGKAVSTTVAVLWGGPACAWGLWSALDD